MKKIGYLLGTFVLLMTVLAFTYPTEKLMEPETLAKLIKSNSPEKPIILNVGPSGPIKGSVLIGSTEDPANKARLTEYLKKIPKDKKVVIYCGCCKLEDCYNIFEANKIMQSSGLSYQILNLPTDFATNWLNKAFPME